MSLISRPKTTPVGNSPFKLIKTQIYYFLEVRTYFLIMSQEIRPTNNNDRLYLKLWYSIEITEITQTEETTNTLYTLYTYFHICTCIYGRKYFQWPNSVKTIVFGKLLLGENWLRYRLKSVYISSHVKCNIMSRLRLIINIPGCCNPPPPSPTCPSSNLTDRRNLRTGGLKQVRIF
jgi:hypothetical protein